MNVQNEKNKSMIIYDIFPEYLINGCNLTTEEFAQLHMIDRYERQHNRHFVLKSIEDVEYECEINGSARLMNAKLITIESELIN